MFIRILRGQAHDGAATLAEVARWRQELGAGVLGWRRLTAGIGDAGELVLALRYDTEAAAWRDRDRPELAAWPFLKRMPFRENASTGSPTRARPNCYAPTRSPLTSRPSTPSR